MELVAELNPGCQRVWNVTFSAFVVMSGRCDEVAEIGEEGR
jgi:hypothetical protein